MNVPFGNILALAVLCAWAGAANAAPLTFNTALPISKDEWILREQFVYMKSTDDPSPMNRRMEVSGLMSVLGYGVTRNFAVFAVLPYADKRLSMNVGGADAQPVGLWRCDVHGPLHGLRGQRDGAYLPHRAVSRRQGADRRRPRFRPPWTAAADASAGFRLVGLAGRRGGIFSIAGLGW